MMASEQQQAQHQQVDVRGMDSGACSCCSFFTGRLLIHSSPSSSHIPVDPVATPGASAHMLFLLLLLPSQRTMISMADGSGMPLLLTTVSIS